MDPAIDRNNSEQIKLEAAKAAFFASGGKAQLIPLGVGKDNLTPPDVPPPRYGYGRIAPTKSKRGRIISCEEKAALAVQLMECKAAGMSRYKASKHLAISETLCRRLITDYSLDFPATG